MALLKSSTLDITKRHSLTKISSYFILLSILFTTNTYLVIDIVNAITSWVNGVIYVIPIEHIGIFTLVLSHHLVLLGLKNSSDKTKIESDKFKFEQGSDTPTDDDKDEIKE